MSTVPSVKQIILGGGGHARVLIESLHASGLAESVCVLDEDFSLWGNDLLGVPILGGDDLLPQLMQQGATHFVVGLGSVGDNRPRRHLFELGLSSGLIPLTVTHPAAVFSKWARIGNGSVLFPCAVVNTCASLGVNVIVNTGAIVEHNCVIGDHVHLATGSRLCGAVHVANGAHIGAGSVVREGISIGAGAIVGAGALVVKDVEPGSVVVGVPARFLKQSGADASHFTPTSKKAVQ